MLCLDQSVVPLFFVRGAGRIAEWGLVGRGLGAGGGSLGWWIVRLV